MSFGLLYRGRRLRVEARGDAAHYDLLDGDPLELEHHGDTFTVAPGSPQTLAVEPLEPRPRPTQPPGREPPECSPEVERT